MTKNRRQSGRRLQRNKASKKPRERPELLSKIRIPAFLFCAQKHEAAFEADREQAFSKYIFAILERRLIQVCGTTADPETRKRELNALGEAMRELGVESGVIVTRNGDENIGVDGGSVKVLPAWRLSLGGAPGFRAAA